MHWRGVGGPPAHRWQISNVYVLWQNRMARLARVLTKNIKYQTLNIEHWTKTSWILMFCDRIGCPAWLEFKPKTLNIEWKHWTSNIEHWTKTLSENIEHWTKTLNIEHWTKTSQILMFCDRIGLPGCLDLKRKTSLTLSAAREHSRQCCKHIWYLWPMQISCLQTRRKSS